MCMHVCASVDMGSHEHVCIFIWRPEDNFIVILQALFSSVLRLGFSLAWKSSSKLSQLNLKDPPVSTLCMYVFVCRVYTCMPVDSFFGCSSGTIYFFSQIGHLYLLRTCQICWTCGWPRSSRDPQVSASPALEVCFEVCMYMYIHIYM